MILAADVSASNSHKLSSFHNILLSISTRALFDKIHLRHFKQGKEKHPISSLLLTTEIQETINNFHSQCLYLSVLFFILSTTQRRSRGSVRQGLRNRRLVFRYQQSDVLSNQELFPQSKGSRQECFENRFARKMHRQSKRHKLCARGLNYKYCQPGSSFAVKEEC